MAESIEPCLGLSIIIGCAIVILIGSCIRIIRPYQKGVVERLGAYIGIMDPGFHMVFPVITRVTFMDMRLQSLDISKLKVLSPISIPSPNLLRLPSYLRSKVSLEISMPIPAW